MTRQTPLIMCHYGNSYYLPYIFRCLNITNPEREIILLGDDSNQWLAEDTGLTHYHFSDYNHGPLISEFEENYRLIQGEKHVNDKGGGKDWVNFVFKRWFYIRNFIEQNNINSFWHFDTDTMVLDDLSRHEDKFKDYDCTEQCSGKCMNGFIANRAVVTNYVKKINDIFTREELLKEQEREFKSENPGFAFTEMRAYLIYKKEESISTYHLAKPINNEVFDDSLDIINDCETEQNERGKPFKKIYLDASGRFFAKKLPSGTLIRFITLNLSRVQEDYFFKVLNHVETKFNPHNTDTPIHLENSVMGKPYPFQLRIRPFLNKLRSIKHSWLSFL